MIDVKRETMKRKIRNLGKEILRRRKRELVIDAVARLRLLKDEDSEMFVDIVTKGVGFTAVAHKLINKYDFLGSEFTKEWHKRYEELKKGESK